MTDLELQLKAVHLRRKTLEAIENYFGIITRAET